MEDRVYKFAEETGNFCHCGALSTAMADVYDPETKKYIDVRACRRCHPKASEMLDKVRDYSAKKGSAPNFTPDELFAMLENEEEKAWGRDKARKDAIEFDRKNEMVNKVGTGSV
jgi:hypothetical protein